MLPERLPSGTDPGLLRRINAVSLLETLRHGGIMTLTALCSATGLSRRTAEGIIESLRSAELLEEVDYQAPHRAAGRPARSFRFLAESGLLVGVQIAAHHVLALATDINGSILGRAEQATRSTSSRAERLQAIRNAIGQSIAGTRIDPKKLKTIAVGTPGAVDQNGRISSCTTLPEWSDFDLADILSTEYGCPVSVNNDTNLSAIGERWRGTGTGFDDVLWVLTGRRTSMGIIINGQLYRGHDGAAGEIGLNDHIWEKVRDHPLSFLGATGRAEAASADEIISGALTGQPDALSSLDDFARLVATGLSGAVLTLNPGCLILGGSFAAAGQLMIPALEKHLAPLCLKLPSLRASGLGGDATAIGAVRAALNRVDEDIRSHLWLAGAQWPRLDVQ